MKRNRSILYGTLAMLFAYGCSKLQEKTDANLTAGQITGNTSTASILLQGVYASLEHTFTSYSEIFPLSELSTDEAIAPTRGGNWDDNGIWRAFHEQNWDPANLPIHDCFNSLAGVVYNATNMLQYNPTTQQQAEARFLRVWAMYWLLDLFNQVPHRDPGDNVVQPAKVDTGINALNYIISEIHAVEYDLPPGPANMANQYAAKTLLMKCYLNKGVYKNRANPSFDQSDLDSVINYANQIINSGQFSFSKDYYDNFSPVNETVGKENIFTQASSSDPNYEIALAWLLVLGDYSPYGGANGFTTLSDFYNKFDSSDKRRGEIYTYPNAPPNPGNHQNVGFLIGPQFDLFTGDPLFNTDETPVNYTPEVSNIEPGPDIVNPGIRPIKYAPDYLHFEGSAVATNEFVYLRFSDVLLMKAEAILRGGTPVDAGSYGMTPESIINAIRTDPSRSTSRITTITTDNLLDERGRELWWENWRRQDMVRFGKFLIPFQEKINQSDPKYLLFPIPYEQIAVNPNLIQNPGY